MAMLVVMVHSGHAQQEGLTHISFFIGTWDIETIDRTPQGGMIKGRARSVVEYILDGKAMKDDFYGLDPASNVIFRGTSIRSFNATTGKFQIVWIMPGITGITDISAEWKDGKLVSTGKGYDSMGEFLERFEYYNITSDSYSFRMDRSYDGGKTWIKNFGQMHAKRVK